MFTFDYILEIQSGEIYEHTRRRNSSSSTIEMDGNLHFKTSEWDVEIANFAGMQFIAVAHDGDSNNRKILPLENGLLLLGSKDMLAGHMRISKFISDSDLESIPDTDETILRRELARLGINHYDTHAKISRDYLLDWSSDNFEVLVSDKPVKYELCASGVNAEIHYAVPDEANIVIIASHHYCSGTLNCKVLLIADKPADLISYLYVLLRDLHLSSFTELFELREAIEHQAKRSQAETEEAQVADQVATEEDE